jgi:uncharacterized protein YggE
MEKIMSGRLLPVLLVAMGLAACKPADAQIAQRVLPDDATLLTLSETAEREVTPDTIRARLLAQASSEQAAAAQNSVNAAMTRALARVRSL